MGKASRDKGKRGEREAAALLRSAGFPAARRGQQYHGGGDSPDVVGLPRMHIEVKRVENLNLYKSIDQAVSDAKLEETPMVLHRKNNKPWLVTMLFLDWIKLYVSAGWGWPGPAPGEMRLTYGEVFTELCRIRDENTELRNELEASKSRLEMAQSERDAVTERMIELEIGDAETKEENDE